MRKLLPILALVAFLVSAAPGEARAAAPCFPKGAKRIAAGAEARVYAKPDPDLGSVVYGCFKRTGRTIMLGENGDDVDIDREYVENVRLNGRMVAFTSGCACREYHARPETFEVVDLRRGRVVRRAMYELYSRISDVVVTRSGSAALIVTHPPPQSASARLAPTPPAGVREVRAIDGRAVTDKGQVLDAGMGIDDDTLRLRGSMLTWWHDGQRRSARLR